MILEPRPRSSASEALTTVRAGRSRRELLPRRVLTMVATRRLDPRLMWDAARRGAALYRRGHRAGQPLGTESAT